MRKARAPRESVARTARTIRKQLYLSGRVLRLLVAASNAARRPTRRGKINNGVELYWDRPKYLWPRTDDGELTMYTRALDLRGLLAEAGAE